MLWTMFTISAKIPRRIKELMDKYGIKPSPLIREALENEVRERILEEVMAKELSKDVSHISDEGVIKVIREDREAK